MLVLVSGATASMRKRSNEWLGELIVPAQKARRSTLTGRPWAGDNGAYVNFDADLFVAMLAKFEGMPGCLFIAAPDVVKDAQTTDERFPRWAKVIRAFGYPVAYVAQNGATAATVPWRDCDAVFIGGDTPWKLGPEARNIIAVAHAHGKHIHMGRVSTRERWEYALSLGVDSIDTSGISKFPDAMLGRFEGWYRERAQQPALSL